MKAWELRQILENGPDDSDVYVLSRIKIDDGGFANIVDIEDPMIVCGARDDVVLVLDHFDEE
jgi:hypothetical protein